MSDSPAAPDKSVAQLPGWTAKIPRIAELMQTQPNAATALEQYGIERFQVADHEMAIQAFSAAAQLAPAHAIYRNNLGVALNASGDSSGAISAFKTSLQIDDDQPQIWLNLAYTFKPLGRLEEARQALLTAAKHPEMALEALTVLGNLELEAGNHTEAAAVLEKALTAGHESASVHATLGATYFQLGELAKAARHYREAARLDPVQPGYHENVAFLTMLEGMVGGDAEAALTAYAKPLSDDAVLISALDRALVFLTSFNHTKAARGLLDEWVQYYPDSQEALYFRQIVAGKLPSRAPEGYIAQHFDELAPRMDDAFFAAIGYNVPALMARILAEGAGPKWSGDVLDAGCGTGVLAETLKPMAKTLTGVDLSPRMLEKAEATKLYDRLVTGDLLTFTQNAPEQFDAIVAADSLIYFGGLELFFGAAYSALRPGGWLIFNIESYDGTEDYHLPISGRFKHRKAYVKAAGKKAFTLTQDKDVTLRLQAGNPVKGTIFLFHKK